MKKTLLLLSAVSAIAAFAGAAANKPLTYICDTISPIPVWGNNDIPFRVPADAERLEKLIPRRDGKRRITNVTLPEIFHFPAQGSKPHPAVLVAPGGGYGYLSWEHEGIDICRWLQKNGFSAFLLKYRCPSRRKAAQADAARAIRVIRFNAKKWNIDPDKIGAIGFSAGAHLCASISAPASEEIYKSLDDADKLPFRPNFTALVYPAFLTRDTRNLKLTNEFNVDKKTPPALLIQTGDDPIKVENSLAWYKALLIHKIPCELHIWDRGGHGYALMLNKHPVSNWHIPAMKWFRRMAKLSE